MKGNGFAIVTGLAGFLLGGIGVFFATDAQREIRDVRNVQIADDENWGDIFERISALERAEQGHTKRINRVTEEEQQLRQKVRELIDRIQELEARPMRGAPRSVDPDSGSDERLEDAGRERQRFEELRAKVWGGEASADEEAEFWKLTRESGVIDEVIQELEKKAEENPRDSGALMNLAGAYVAKLLSVPDGPERGAWAVKSEAQYQKILEFDPDHWQARYSLAFSWSQWPPFMNKAPAAIEQFEKLREIQERGAPEAHHSGVYLQLANLYRGQGNDERAKKTLEDGIDRHPDAQGLQDALDAATR